RRHPARQRLRPLRPGGRWGTRLAAGQYLTPRERQVLGLMAEGHDNATIARTLVVTARAVHKHIGNVFLELGLPPGDSGHRRVLAVLAYLARTPQK
ncbi:LuxR C-terminal-related transcriptional regulator, partial [Streptomyces sp. NPDC007162]|uniref:response regulator transcription factor n=1 Tax=Streptomyces sp. NPDC007162 TaxID=3156917 RepID=UPI0033EC733E